MGRRRRKEVKITEEKDKKKRTQIVQSGNNSKGDLLPIFCLETA